MADAPCPPQVTKTCDLAHQETVKIVKNKTALANEYLEMHSARKRCMVSSRLTQY